MCKRKSWMSKVRPGQGQGGRDGETEARRRNGAASAPCKELVSACPSATSFPLGARLSQCCGAMGPALSPPVLAGIGTKPPPCVLLRRHPARPRTGCLPARASGWEIHSPRVICLLFFQETHSELISSRASAGSVGSIPALHPPAGPSTEAGDPGVRTWGCPPWGCRPPGTSRPQNARVLASWALGRGLSLS